MGPIPGTGAMGTVTGPGGIILTTAGTAGTAGNEASQCRAESMGAGPQRGKAGWLALTHGNAQSLTLLIPLCSLLARLIPPLKRQILHFVTAFSGHTSGENPVESGHNDRHRLCLGVVHTS